MEVYIWHPGDGEVETPWGSLTSQACLPDVGGDVCYEFVLLSLVNKDAVFSE